MPAPPQECPAHGAPQSKSTSRLRRRVKQRRRGARSSGAVAREAAARGARSSSSGLRVSQFVPLASPLRRRPAAVSGRRPARVRALDRASGRQVHPSPEAQAAPPPPRPQVLSTRYRQATGHGLADPSRTERVAQCRRCRQPESSTGPSACALEPRLQHFALVPPAYAPYGCSVRAAVSSCVSNASQPASVRRATAGSRELRSQRHTFSAAAPTISSGAQSQQRNALSAAGAGLLRMRAKISVECKFSKELCRKWL